LKAGEYATVIKLENAIADMRRQSEEMRAQGRAAAEQAKKQGYVNGLREGKEEIAGQFFEAVTASVGQLAGMETAMVDVAVKALRTILGRFDRVELAKEVIGHALRLVRDDKRVVLRVAPDSAPSIEQHLAEIMQPYPGIVRVDVVPDKAVKSEGCVMETELGIIDATLDRQLKMIEDTLRRQFGGVEEKKTDAE
jgi:type III secretion protein L